ncbi:Two-component transcriptional response regulator, LuxR family [hydrothermal vent metagenome]|uniref:Two-component transcriptional response regulator, LuxR family n=1 Tax=hydrothermal vent metagenome TaxID=652676 RepID=A0A3B1AMB9_9ZZZZ
MLDNNISILLVEDDEVDVMSIQRAFSKNHITNPVHVAGNGLEALAMLRGTDGQEKLNPMPKIILLDINMPKMNGIEFLKELRSDADLRSISVFVLTTSDEEKDRMAAYDMNVAGYILKPVEPGKFMEAVKTLDVFWSLIELP